MKCFLAWFIMAAIVALMIWLSVAYAQTGASTEYGDQFTTNAVSVAYTQTVLLAISGGRVAWALSSRSTNPSTTAVYFVSTPTVDATTRANAFTNALFKLAPGSNLMASAANFSLKPALFTGVIYAESGVNGTTNVIDVLELKHP